MEGEKINTILELSLASHTPLSAHSYRGPRPRLCSSETVSNPDVNNNGKICFKETVLRANARRR